MSNHQFTTPTVVYLGPVYSGHLPVPTTKVAPNAPKPGR